MVEAELSLQSFLRSSILSYPVGRRLGFRELALAIGVQGLTWICRTGFKTHFDRDSLLAMLALNYPSSLNDSLPNHSVVNDLRSLRGDLPFFSGN